MFFKKSLVVINGRLDELWKHGSEKLAIEKACWRNDNLKKPNE
jgi:hypothetical protein